MKHDELVFAIRDLATKTNAGVGNANWHLFGSAKRETAGALDIDLVIVCQTHGVADEIRRSLDVDQLPRPIHLSIFTQAEEAEIRFVEKQDCILIV